MSRALTPKLARILSYLRSYSDEHGYMPSFQEIADHCGYSTLATVHEHLDNLARKGFIRRAFNRSRAIELLPSDTDRLRFAYYGRDIEEIRETLDAAMREAGAA